MASNTLSSAQTFLVKFVVPVFWFAAFPIFVAITLLSPGASPSDEGVRDPVFIVFLAVAFLANTYWIWRFCLPLKVVRMDDQALYISNFSQEIRVPLSNVAEVSENRWLKEHPVTIRFHSETEFGPKIIFMPTVRLFAFWSPHPVVEQIRRAVAYATGSAPAGPVE